MLLPLYQLSYVTITNSTQFKPGNPSASPSSASPSGPSPSSFCNVIFKHLWETGNISVNICAQTESLLPVQTITNANCNQRFKIKTMTLLLSSLSPLWLQLWHYWVSCMLKYCLIILIQKTSTTSFCNHNQFTALFPGPPGLAGARRELVDFMVQGKINRGRHADHLHSIWTNQCPPPPSPIFFTGRMPFLPPNQQRQTTEGTIFLLQVVKKFDKRSHRTRGCFTYK